MYQNYKYARNRVWETLIECNLNQLPINLAVVQIFIIFLLLNIVKATILLQVMDLAR